MAIFAVIVLGSIGTPFTRAAAPYTQATVTRMENKVSYGKQREGHGATRPAVVQDVVKANSFLLSGNASRAELQYPDRSIVRIGQNTVFSFEAKSRTLTLSEGVFFFYVPRGSGSTNIKTPSLSAGITGTVGKVTVSSIVILDGSIRLIPSRRVVSAGQFARRNPDGSITIDYFDASRAPSGIVSAAGTMVRKGLERDVLDLVKYHASASESGEKPRKPTSIPTPKHTDAVAKAAGQEAAKDAARNAAAKAAAQAALAASKAASSTASKEASKSASKGASKAAPKPQTPHYHPSGGMCFVGGTLVRTPSGVREIEDLTAEDQVLSFNERTGRIEPARVLRTLKSQRADLIKLRTQDDSITCSQNHRFYTVDQGWLAANELKTGSKIMQRNPADPRKITAISTRAVAAQNLKSAVNVYNLTVAKNSNYFVGRDALLCHNVK